MKKFTLFINILVIVMIVVCIIGACSITNKINMDFVKDAKVIFIYNDANVSHNLSDEELLIIKDIFNGKKMYKDNLSCGFSEDISIKFNNSQTFCVARDSCPIVYWKEEDRFIKITEDEKFKLYSVLEMHGFTFPCV
ncbi:MAG: hypothetical protein IJZ94_05370 [Clostridia bacterium]|nr:hypothetical protein [Clostridia bacterium]